MSVQPAAAAAPPALAGPPRFGVWARLNQIRRSYLLRVVASGIFTIWLVMTLTFFMVRQMPGSPFEVAIDGFMTRQSMTYDEAYRAAATLYNFDPDRPILAQYGDYVGDLVRGDFGTSISRPGTPVMDVILRYLPWTLFSVGLALLISFSVGTLLGLTIGFWRGTWFDNLISMVASLLSGIPDYIIALLLVIIGGVQLGLFQVGQLRGGVDPTVTVGFTLEFILSVLQYAILPVLVYVLSSVGTWVLAMKSSTISTLGEDYITVAQARGLPRHRVLTAYVGRNAMLPLITRLAISIGFVVSGSVIVEEMFQYPGLGRNLFLAISARDYTLMQGIFLVITAAVVFSNILADLVMGWLDPRVRLNAEDN